MTVLRLSSSWGRVALALLAAAAVVAASVPARDVAHAQQAKARNKANNGNANANANANGNDKRIPDLNEGPVDLPPAPPQGAWGAVVFANARWMVVQNSQGQQFPINMDSVNQFLIRWPTSIDALTEETLVEVSGVDNNNNSIRTDHIDVFEGSDRTLVSPTAIGFMPINRPVPLIQPNFNLFLDGAEFPPDLLLNGWAYPLSGEVGGPFQLHAVGAFFRANPLIIRMPGNNMAGIVPADGNNLTVTQVSRGNSSFAEKGDLVYLMPVDLTTRSVVLSQLVLYKKIPLSRFRLP